MFAGEKGSGILAQSMLVEKDGELHCVVPGFTNPNEILDLEVKGGQLDWFQPAPSWFNIENDEIVTISRSLYNKYCKVVTLAEAFPLWQGKIWVMIGTTGQHWLCWCSAYGEKVQIETFIDPFNLHNKSFESPPIVGRDAIMVALNYCALDILEDSESH